MRMILAVMFLAVTLSACGEKKEIKDTVFAPAVQAKDNARGGRPAQGGRGEKSRGPEGIRTG
jgi:hypothetical protein